MCEALCHSHVSFRCAELATAPLPAPFGPHLLPSSNLSMFNKGNEDTSQTEGWRPLLLSSYPTVATDFSLFGLRVWLQHQGCPSQLLFSVRLSQSLTSFIDCGST
uniref:Uncharacterized protein n=1 Tax=Sphaerodactylus townsendi TaxID=933632 RepID=A0ACB8FXK8_9SAUR